MAASTFQAGSGERVAFYHEKYGFLYAEQENPERQFLEYLLPPSDRIVSVVKRDAFDSIKEFKNKTLFEITNLKQGSTETKICNVASRAFLFPNENSEYSCTEVNCARRNRYENMYRNISTFDKATTFKIINDGNDTYRIQHVDTEKFLYVKGKTSFYEHTLQMLKYDDFRSKDDFNKKTAFKILNKEGLENFA